MTLTKIYKPNIDINLSFSMIQQKRIQTIWKRKVFKQAKNIKKYILTSRDSFRQSRNLTEAGYEIFFPYFLILPFEKAAKWNMVVRWSFIAIFFSFFVTDAKKSRWVGYFFAYEWR